jgi:hypothetical protein
MSCSTDPRALELRHRRPPWDRDDDPEGEFQVSQALGHRAHVEF